MKKEKTVKQRRPWTPKEMELVKIVDSPEEVARLTKRTITAVISMRYKLQRTVEEVEVTTEEPKAEVKFTLANGVLVGVSKSAGVRGILIQGPNEFKLL